MAQVVEHLHEDLSSNPSPNNEKKKKKKDKMLLERSEFEETWVRRGR
jgi:hypothetical protein